MRFLFLLALGLLLAGCATLELIEDEEHYKGRWVEVRAGDTVGKSGYNRIQTYIRDNEFLEDNPVFADAIEANGLPNYVYVVDILRFRIAYARLKQVQEWSSSDPYELLRTYAWNDCPAPLPPSPAAAPVPGPAARTPPVAVAAPATPPAASPKPPATPPVQAFALPAANKPPASPVNSGGSAPPATKSTGAGPSSGTPPPPPPPSTYALPEMPGVGE